MTDRNLTVTNPEVKGYSMYVSRVESERVIYEVLLP